MVQEARRMQGYGSDFIKEMFAAAKNPDMISFAGVRLLQSSTPWTLSALRQIRHSRFTTGPSWPMTALMGSRHLGSS